MTGSSIKTDVTIPMGDPIAYFLTWVTYGTWLPGDQRGWVEYHHGWQLPDSQLKLTCAARMTEDICLLDERDRLIVEKQVAETCRFRKWKLHTCGCRSNHCHVVCMAVDVKTMKIRDDLKAWCTRRLNENSSQNRTNWWAERGSIRWIWNQESLDRVIKYVNEAQDRGPR